MALLGGLARKAIDGWALAGGLVLGLVVLVNVLTVLGGPVGRPFAGDFELTQMGVAFAAFAFLPYCQLHRDNVTADLFTRHLGGRTRSRLAAAGSAVALGFAALLLWRMSLGLVDQRSYGYTSTILQIPLWWAYVPILVSLGLLAVAAAITLTEDVKGAD